MLDRYKAKRRTYTDKTFFTNLKGKKKTLLNIQSNLLVID